MLIGLTNVTRALSRMLDMDLLNQRGVLLLSIVLFLLVMIPIGKKLFQKNVT